MPAATLPTKTRAPLWLERAARRLNPSLSLEVDILAVKRAAGASTYEEWSAAGTKTNVAVSPGDGAVRLAEGTERAIFASGGAPTDASYKYHFYSADNSGQNEILWLDFYPDPNVVGPHGFTLHSVDLVLGRFDASPFAYAGNVRVTVATIDEYWNRHILGTPVDLTPSEVSKAGGLVNVAFLERGHRFDIAVGQRRYTSGTGLDASGNDRQSPTGDITTVSDKKWHSWTAPVGFSIGLSVSGPFLGAAFAGLLPDGVSYPQFDTGAFWRTGLGAYDSGPYDPRVDGAYYRDGTKFPGDGVAQMGAAPGGFGTKPTTQTNGTTAYGEWGQSREVAVANKPNTTEQNGWQQAYHVVRAVTYDTSGTLVSTFDLGAVPSDEVHFRADTVEPTGTSVTFTARGSNDNATWTALGTITDGAIVPGWRYYELTATLAGSSDGFASPALIAAFFTERVRNSTFRYAREVDSTVTVDPVTGQSEISELKLPLVKAGADDLITRLATEYAPSQVEAWVYLRESVSGNRYFLNLFRLEDREPQLGEEGFTFVSGMDRLKVKVPQAVESYTYPTDGSEGVIATISRNTTTQECTIGVSGTPFATIALAGMRFQGDSGALAGVAYQIAQTPAPTASAFTIILEATDPTPNVGDLFTIHSDVTQRVEQDYTGEDPAAAYADVLANHAAVPARYRGALPPATVYTTNGKLASDGREALGPVQELALLCGGAVTWRRGRMDYVDLYGPKDVRAVWDEREYTSLATTIGAARRMPSVAVKYDFDWGAGKFVRELTENDDNAVQGWGRANLFDVSELPDDLCKWLNAELAGVIARRFVTAWSTGVRLWKVETVTMWPWLELGDAVAISTTQYTDRRIRFEDGADKGDPVKGRVSAVGVIVGKNLVGDSFIVAVPGLDAITSDTSGTQTDGTVTHPELEPLPCPALTLSSSTVGLLAHLQFPTLVMAFTPPDSPFYSHMEFEVDDGTGSPAVETSSSSSPVRLRASWGTSYTVTPYVVTVAGVRAAGTPQTIALPNNWRVGRTIPFVDGSGADDGFALKATDVGGLAANPNVGDNRGALLNGMFRYGVDNATGVLETSGLGFVDPTYTNARRVNKVWSDADALAITGSQTVDDYRRSVAGWRDQAAGLASAANDTRGALLNNHFRYGVDALTGVMDDGNYSRVSTGTVAGGTVFRTAVTDGARSANYAPSQYAVGTTREFKDGYYLGVPGHTGATNAYFGALETIKHYSDNSAGGNSITQTFRSSVFDGQVWKRSAGAGAADWSASSGWRRVFEAGTMRVDLTTGHADSTMQDSRAALLNAMFRYGVDSTDGLVDGTGSPIAGGKRGYTGLDASGNVQTGLTDNALVSGVPAAQLTTMGNRLFSESWDAPDPTKSWSGFSNATIQGALGNGGIMGSNVVVCNDYNPLEYRRAFPINPNKLYKFVARVRQTSNGTGGLPYTYLGFLGRKGDGSAANNNGGAIYVLSAGMRLITDLGTSDWVEFTAWVGRGATQAYTNAGAIATYNSGTPEAPQPFNIGTTAIVPYMLLNYPGVSATAGAQCLSDYFQIWEYDEDGTVRVYNAIDSGGTQLTSGVLQSDGVTGRVIAKGHAAGFARNADHVNFPQNYQNPPLILLRGGILAEPRAKWGATGSGSESGAFNSALPVYEDLKALNITTSGFDLRARLRQKSGSTAREDYFTPAANAISAVGQTTQCSLTAYPANDDTYTAHYNVSLSLTPAAGNVSNLSVDVALDYYNGSGWFEGASKNYSLRAIGQPRSISFSGETMSVTASGVTALRLRVSDVTWTTDDPASDTYTDTIHGYGQISDGNGGVTYNTSVDNFASKTPDSDDVIFWEAIEVS